MIEKAPARFPVVAALLLLACGSDPTPQPGPDAAVDAAADSPPDNGCIQFPGTPTVVCEGGCWQLNLERHCGRCGNTCQVNERCVASGSTFACGR